MLSKRGFLKALGLGGAAAVVAPAVPVVAKAAPTDAFPYVEKVSTITLSSGEWDVYGRVLFADVVNDTLTNCSGGLLANIEQHNALLRHLKARADRG